MTRESIIALGIAIMCLSIFIFNAFKTKDEYLWGEAIGIMLIIDLPIGGLLFWLLSMLSPVVACIWGAVSPFVIYKFGEFIDNRKTDKESNAQGAEPQTVSVAKPQVQAETIVRIAEKKDTSTDVVPQSRTVSPVEVDEKDKTVSSTPSQAEIVTAKPLFEDEEKQVKQTLQFCLRCGKKITGSICEECKYDHTERVLLLNRVDPRKLQLAKK